MHEELKTQMNNFFHSYLSVFLAYTFLSYGKVAATGFYESSEIRSKFNNSFHFKEGLQEIADFTYE